MAFLYLRSYIVEPNLHPQFVDSGYRHAKDFKMDFVGASYATIVFTLLWNEDKKLVPGTTRTKTTVVGAAVALSKEGIGWATIADIAGDDPWVAYKNTVIRFRKRFTVELPVAPALSAVPVVGDLAKELGATRTMRIEVEGYFDVISEVKDLQARIF